MAGTPWHEARAMSMPQARQQDFYASVAGMGSEGTVAAAETLQQSETTSNVYAENGEYLPLGVWHNRGFQSFSD